MRDLKRLLLIAAVTAIVCSIGGEAFGAGRTPRMTGPAAKHYAAIAFKRDDQGLLWRYSKHKRITGCKRISRPRMRCKARWQLRSASITDLRYSGHVTIWYSRSRGRLWWNYAYDIKSVDRVCQKLADPRFDCIHHYHVK